MQDILENFEFRNQIPRLSKADALGTLIEKFLSPDVNLSPKPVLNGDGSVKHPGLDNHAMGTIFEELVRRFNEENNEEAGEHCTPRDAVRLMPKLVFLPIADQIESGTYLVYDGACGTGGMLTVAQDTLQHLAEEHGKQVATHLYGQEINAETYAICKADLLLKGEGEAADNIVVGPEHSTSCCPTRRTAKAGKAIRNVCTPAIPCETVRPRHLTAEVTPDSASMTKMLSHMAAGRLGRSCAISVSLVAMGTHGPACCPDSVIIRRVTP